ncbi:MazG-like family protein [Pseudovibrio ascidiaceicola]|uniref:MazG-like family protein n=1 Tax=Pseudovibrio ascidiaceicola TaxID=285279 RepID=UPI003D35CBC8
MKFQTLRNANTDRQREWPGNEKIDIAFRAIEVAGEFGEVCEAVKKYLRESRAIAGSTATISDIANEMADAIIALDLLASQLEINLGEAVASKFNLTSAKYGLKTQLPQHQETLAGDRRQNQNQSGELEDISAEMDRMMLVIETAVRWQEGKDSDNHQTILALLQKNKAVREKRSKSPPPPPEPPKERVYKMKAGVDVRQS